MAIALFPGFQRAITGPIETAIAVDSELAVPIDALNAEELAEIPENHAVPVVLFYSLRRSYKPGDDDNRITTVVAPGWTVEDLEQLLWMRIYAVMAKPAVGGESANLRVRRLVWRETNFGPLISDQQALPVSLLDGDDAVVASLVMIAGALETGDISILNGVIPASLKPKENAAIAIGGQGAGEQIEEVVAKTQRATQTLVVGATSLRDAAAAGVIALPSAVVGQKRTLAYERPFTGAAGMPANVAAPLFSDLGGRVAVVKNTAEEFIIAASTSADIGAAVGVDNPQDGGDIPGNFLNIGGQGKFVQRGGMWFAVWEELPAVSGLKITEIYQKWRDANPSAPGESVAPAVFSRGVFSEVAARTIYGENLHLGKQEISRVFALDDDPGEDQNAEAGFRAGDIARVGKILWLCIPDEDDDDEVAWERMTPDLSAVKLISPTYNDRGEKDLLADEKFSDWQTLHFVAGDGKSTASIPSALFAAGVVVGESTTAGDDTGAFSATWLSDTSFQSNPNGDGRGSHVREIWGAGRVAGREDEA